MKALHGQLELRCSRPGVYLRVRDERQNHVCPRPVARHRDVRQGELLVKQVYEALRASPAWEKTALIITYDEHGGFWDHVPPPQDGVPPPGECTIYLRDLRRPGPGARTLFSCLRASANKERGVASTRQVSAGVSRTMVQT